MAIIHTGLECRGFVAVGAEPTCEHRDGIAVISLYSSENIIEEAGFAEGSTSSG